MRIYTYNPLRPQSLDRCREREVRITGTRGWGAGVRLQLSEAPDVAHGLVLTAAEAKQIHDAVTQDRAQKRQTAAA